MTPDGLLAFALAGWAIPLASLVTAIGAFLYSAKGSRMTELSSYEKTQAERITDLCRERDELKADLADAERENRALRRALSRYGNGGAP